MRLSQTSDVNQQLFSVIEQKVMIDSKSVLESVNTRMSTLRLNNVPTVCAIGKPASNACATAYNSAASTDLVTRLHFFEHQLSTEQLPLSSARIITNPSCDERSLFVANDASAKTCNSAESRSTLPYCNSTFVFLRRAKTSSIRLNSASLASIGITCAAGSQHMLHQVECTSLRRMLALDAT
eukprot:IDg12229t1